MATKIQDSFFRVDVALIVYSVETELKGRIKKIKLYSHFYQLKGLLVRLSNLRWRGCAL